MLPLSLLISSAAHAVGGAFIGPVGSDVPISSDTIVALAVADGRTTVTVTARTSGAVDFAAFLWPADGVDPDSLARPMSRGLENLEAFTRPRVERLTCDELVSTLRYRTPPGCASYEVEELGSDPVGEDATHSFGVDPTAFEALPEISVIAAADVPDWLAERDLEIPASAEDALQPWLDAGTPLVAAFLPAAVPAGVWLPPVQFTIAGTEVPLPLRAGSDTTDVPHALTVLTLTTADVGDPAFANLAPGLIRDECRLPSGTDAEDWWAAEIDAADHSVTAPWFRVYAGPADRCAPCAAELPNFLVYEHLGLDSDTNNAAARVGRIEVRYGPGELSDDPVLSFSAPRVDSSIRWYQDEEGIGFLIEECGGDVDPGAVCPQLQRLESSGCAVPPGAPFAAGTVLLVLLAIRRRRHALVAVALLAVALPAQAADHGVPHTEVHLSAGLLGTARFGAEDRAQTPTVRLPTVGAQARISVFSWKDDAGLGLIGGLAGWRGGAGDAVNRFTLLEPHAGIDLRHGTLREGARFAPFAHVGASFVLPAMVPRLGQATVTLSGRFHAGAGAWLGHGPLRPSLAIEGVLVPRTDGFVTRFDSITTLPGYTFFPGAARVSVLVGLGIN